MNAVSTLPKQPLPAQNKSLKTGSNSLHEQSTVSNLHNNSHENLRDPSQKTVPSSQYQDNQEEQQDQ